MRRVIFCGDRHWTKREPIVRALQEFDPNEWIIVHGAARGADTLAGEIATTLGFKVEAYPAKWDEYGRAAGPIRNAYMLALEDPAVQWVVAFHANIKNSKGTKDMITRAQKKGVMTEVITK